ncbi:hypothetical protein C8Q78DRAFT_1067958 [Trametes maxima]|nr:hypothetical protein C8Q78DRAFT_1067958 [Trametes maxima]
MSIRVHASCPVPIFDPYASSKAAFASLDAHVDRRNPQFVPRFPATAPSALGRGREAPDRAPPYPSYHAAPIVLPADVNADHHEGDKAMDAHRSQSPAPPPVPPKSPVRGRPKAVSILVPTDISPAKLIFSHSQPDVAHSYRPTTNGAAASSDGAPVPGMILPSPHVSATTFADVTSPSAKAPHVRPSIEPAMRKASSARARRNKLHKARHHQSLPSLPLGSSLFGSLFSRAFWSHDSSRDHSRSSSGHSMSDRFYPPTRSVSDGRLVGIKRPSPRSQSSHTTDSSCTTSSSASTAQSSASTALTTPDSTPPSLSPHNSTRSVHTNKLHKRRPPPAPSAAYQYPLGASSTALGRSKSTPTGLGQRPQRGRNWSSVEEARHAAEEAESVDSGPDPTSWYTSSTELSPSRWSTLDPIFEDRARNSSHALAQLACTGLCSTSVAALSSQLALQTELLDCQSTYEGETFEGEIWDDTGTEHFDPSFPSHVDTSSTASPSLRPRNAEGSSSGFSVVRGSLDRSEDAMRRWTLAMADVPDEVLVQNLERLRKESLALARGQLPGRRSAAPSQNGHGDEESTLDTRHRRSSFFFGGPREMGISARSPSNARFSVGPFDRELDGESDDETLSDEDNEEDWKTARQVLFCCRELVQTERNYQARLRELASTELSPHYASLIAQHIPALLRVSATLLAHLVDDPSAWGVSAAFIGCEEELEAALVAWSAVVGEFFVEDANLKPSRKLTKKLMDDTFTYHESPTPSMRLSARTRSHGGIASIKRDNFGGRRFSTTLSDFDHDEASSSTGHGMFTAALGTGLGFGLSVPPSSPFDPDTSPVRSPRSRVGHGHGHKANASTASGLGLTRAVSAVNVWKRKSMPSSLSNLPSLVNSQASPTTPHSPTHSPGHNYHHHPHSSGASAHGHGKKHSEHDAKAVVRDLAIQPTQRVMRYVLLYRGLLEHTPVSSPSRALVERAHESAVRIVKRCDRAQAHAGFLRQQPQK